RAERHHRGARRRSDARRARARPHARLLRPRAALRRRPGAAPRRARARRAALRLRRPAPLQGEAAPQRVGAALPRARAAHGRGRVFPRRTVVRLRARDAPPRGTRLPALCWPPAMESAQQSDAPIARPYEPNGLLRWLYRRFFSHITVDDKWSTHVRDAARRGVVVYVMRSLSFLDFFCLDFLVKQYGLPLVRFVNDLGLWILEPFGKGERRLSLRPQVPQAKA